MSLNLKRLFFAVKLGDDARKTLSNAQSALTTPQARAVPPENFHLTLAFVGKFSEEEQQRLHSEAEKIHGESCSLTLDQYGYFSKQKIFWIGASETSPALLALHRQLCQAIAHCGLRAPKKFTPHITLLRKATLVTPHGETPSVNLSITHFSMMQSIPVENGVRYQSLAEYALEAHSHENNTASG